MVEWDFRKGQVFPSVARQILEILSKDDSGFKVPQVRKLLDDRVEMSQSTLPNLMRIMGKADFLDVDTGRSWRSPNVYRLSDKGRKWWDIHKEEGWGYGEEWEPEEGWPDSKHQGDGKLTKAVRSGRQVRIGLPCQVDIWREFSSLAQTGEVEIVVRMKRDG